MTAALDGLRGSCLIGAEWRRGTSGEALVVTDPSDGTAVHEVALAGPADVDAAVAAARAAFPAWSGATPGERSAALLRLAAVLEERADDLAEAESRQAGKPIRLSTEFDVPGTIDNAAFFAGAARDLEGDVGG